MALTSDTFIERSQLKRQVAFWRLAAVGVIVFFLIILVERNAKLPEMSGTDNNHIARVIINDTVTENQKFYDLLDEIKEDDDIKAVILHLNTPGGAAVAGETIFRKIKEISEKKPVVASMRSVCASAGYMISLAADHVLAMNGTITGSIGVIFQSVQAKELIDKVGVKPITITSGKLKGSPSMYEPLTTEGRQAIQSMIDEFHSVFVSMVAEARDLPIDEVKTLSDGRIYSGPRAVELGLVDAIGDENDALAWLEKEHNIDISLDIKDMKVKTKFDAFYDKVSQVADIEGLTQNNSLSDGLLLIWHPDLY